MLSAEAYLPGIPIKVTDTNDGCFYDSIKEPFVELYCFLMGIGVVLLLIFRT